MKQIDYHIALVCFLIGFMGCSATEPENVNESNSNFAIYFLADENMRAEEVMEKGINEVEFDSEPWLSEADITFYDFSSHCIYLKTDKSDFFEYYAGGRFEPILMNKPFVVVAGGTRCYIGSLRSGLLSTAPPGPYMDELDLWYYPSDVMHISKAWSGENDPRSTDQIRDALSDLGLYHGGLEITLESANVHNSSSISTIQYTISITNLDADALLFMDPDLMGSARFHYFTNGVVFHNESGNYWAENRKVISPEPFDSWERSWFTRSGPGESLQRTVELEGYPEIPAGTYDCQLKFSHPTRIAKADRYFAGARYWLGEISTRLTVTVD